MTKLERIILNTPPVRFLSDKSKRIILPGFEEVPLYDVIVFFVNQAKKTGFNERAAAISYNLIMAIPPTLIFLFTLIPYLPISTQFTRELFRFIHDLIPGESNYHAVRDFLSDLLNRPRNGLLSFGFISALYFASNAMIGIMRSFDKNYIGFRKRTFFQKRGMAIRLTLILLLLISASILLLITQGAVLRWFGIHSLVFRWIIRSIRWVVIVALFFYSIGFIYKHAPAVQKKWKLISPGTIIATFLTILFTLLFSYWVTNFGNYNKLYGSIGTVMILMVLIYFNSLVLLVGYEINVSIHSIRAMAGQREANETGNRDDGLGGLAD